jgi:hypothetical protein
VKFYPKPDQLEKYFSNPAIQACFGECLPLVKILKYLFLIFTISPVTDALKYTAAVQANLKQAKLRIEFIFAIFARQPTRLIKSWLEIIRAMLNRKRSAKLTPQHVR